MEDKTNATLVGTMEEKEAPANNATEEKKEEPRASINVEPSDFDEDAGVVFLTGTQLREKINAMFRAVFADFDSCSLHFNNGNAIDVVTNTIGANMMYADLHFRETTVDGFHMLKHRSETKGSSLLSRINYTIGQNNSRAYTLNEDGLEALEEFLPGFNPKNRKKVTLDQWNRRVFETNMAAAPGMLGYGMYGGNAIDVVITGFPIESILKKIYGAKKDSEFFDYACYMMRTTMNRDIILQITQLKASVVNKLSSMVGIPNMYNYGVSSNMYTYNSFPNYMTPPTGVQNPQQ